MESKSTRKQGAVALVLDLAKAFGRVSLRHQDSVSGSLTAEHHPIGNASFHALTETHPDVVFKQVSLTMKAHM